ncbi:glycosyltransferase [Candidatus Fermentibacterales bacterium]|nr:glycosyltransferase [Candidatus Fermentibacterales bacterium]
MSGSGTGAPVLCDVTMFWSPIGGGVRKYIERKRDWLRRRMPGVGHLLIVPGPSSSASEGPGSGHVTCVVRGLSLPFAPGYRVPPSKRETVEVLRRFAPHVIECGSPFVMRGAVSSFLRERPETAVFDYYHAYFPLNYAAALGRGLAWLRRPLIGVGWPYLARRYRDSRKVLLGASGIEKVLHSRGITHTTVAPLGIDLSFFSSEGPGTRPEPPVLLFVGRLSEEKGLSAVMGAYSLLKGRTGARLRVVGDGIMMKRLLRAAELDPGIEVLGFVAGEEMPRVYRSSTLLVSAAPAETLGFCFLEALACGIPVVGIEGSGLVGTLPPDVCVGVRSASPPALAGACESLIASSPEPSRCRQAVEGYDWEPSIERIVALELREAGLAGLLEGAGT